MAFGEKVFEGNVCVTNVTPVMTSNSSPSPFVISSNAAVYSNAKFPFWKAFDSSATTYTSLNQTTIPVTFQLDYGAGNQYKINRFILTANTSAMMKAYTFEGSNDATNWDVLYTVEEQEKVSVSIYTFKNTGFYRYYRFNISEKWATALEICDVKFYSLDKFLYINKIKAENLTLRTDGSEDLNFLDNGKITITQRESNDNTYLGMPKIATSKEIYDEDGNQLENNIHNGIVFNKGIYYKDFTNKSILPKIDYTNNLHYNSKTYYNDYLYTKKDNAISIITDNGIDYIIVKIDDELDENSENLIRNDIVTQKLKDFRDNL